MGLNVNCPALHSRLRHTGSSLRSARWAAYVPNGPGISKGRRMRNFFWIHERHITIKTLLA